MKSHNKKPESSCQQDRRRYHEFFRCHGAADICLRHAQDRRSNYYLVRVPKATRVGSSFALRLGVLAEELSAGKSFRVSIPVAKIEPEWRNYILCDDWHVGGRYVIALARALKVLEVLEVAQVFHADPDAGVMRRIVVGSGGMHAPK